MCHKFRHRLAAGLRSGNLRAEPRPCIVFERAVSGDVGTQYVLVPFCLDSRWVLIVLRLDHEKRGWTAQIFDSLISQGTERARRARRLIQRATLDRTEEKKPHFYKWSKLQVEILREIPLPFIRRTTLTAAS